ncbi:hypothetical protein FRC15_005966 [Serendipita sp. 397]|nr:hypothetical protein FRC15_005966 [Serendipita sp. 397]
MSEEVKLSTDPSSTYTLWRLRHVAEATPSAMRELLSSREWKTQTGELAIQVVKLQLQIYDQNLKAAAQISGSANRVPSPMEAAARKLAESLDDDPDASPYVSVYAGNKPQNPNSISKWTSTPGYFKTKTGSEHAKFETQTPPGTSGSSHSINLAAFLGPRATTKADISRSLVPKWMDSNVSTLTVSRTSISNRISTILPVALID